MPTNNIYCRECLTHYYEESISFKNSNGKIIFMFCPNCTMVTEMKLIRNTRFIM